MEAINKAIELLEKVLEENYNLSETYEIKPETRDEIEAWLKGYIKDNPLCMCEGQNIDIINKIYTCKKCKLPLYTKYKNAQLRKRK